MIEVKPRTYSVAEAAQVLGVSRQMVYELCRTESFPSLRLGKRIRIPIESLHDWIRRAGEQGA